MPSYTDDARGDIPTRNRAEAVFHAPSEGGMIQFQQTFWTTGFGVLVDRFGIPREVNSEVGGPAPSGCVVHTCAARRSRRRR